MTYAQKGLHVLEGARIIATCATEGHAELVVRSLNLAMQLVKRHPAPASLRRVA